MKNIFLVTAMEEELNALEPSSQVKTIQEKNMELKKFALGPNMVYAMIGGIGKVSMAYRLGKALSMFQADILINMGVAGSVASDLKPLTTLIADKCIYWDADVTAFGYKYGQMAGMPYEYEPDRELVKEAMGIDIGKRQTGLILSGDSFMTKKNTDSSILAKFDHPVAIDMESAAVGQVAHLENIPFLIVRTISDDVEGSWTNKEQYDQLLNEASLNSALLVKDLIENIH